MKVLMVNKFLYPKGGSETYFLKLGEILLNHGHEIEYFGIEDKKNTVGNRINSYAPAKNLKTSIKQNLGAPFSIIYSAAARKKMMMVLRDFQPDVIHLNNIQYYLTPSIILAVNDYRKETNSHAKLVYTAHDYQLVCPSHGLFDKDLKPCERCLNMQYYPCFLTKCLKSSRMKSFLGMVDGYFWKHNRAYSYVDNIICPSGFLKSKLDQQERYRDKTVMIHNFVDKVEDINVEKEDYILEFGHLSKDKGTDTLIKAAEKLPDIKFIFAGFGESTDKIRNLQNAEYVGFQSGKSLEMLIRKAKLVVVPSECPENCSFSIIEAQQYKTPVLASRIGGNPELIIEGQTGELFEAGNTKNLIQKIQHVFENYEAIGYSENCKNIEIETKESYYKKLMEIYTHENI